MKTIEQRQKRALTATGALLLGSLLLLPAAPTLAQQPSQEGGSSPSRASASAPSRSAAPSRNTSPSRGSGSSGANRQSAPPPRQASPAPNRGSADKPALVRPSGSQPYHQPTHPSQVSGDEAQRHRAPDGNNRGNEYRQRNDERYSSNYHHHHYPGCGHYYYGYGYGLGYGYYYPYAYYPHRYYGPYGYVYYPQVYVESGYRYDATTMGAIDFDVSPEKAQIFIDGTPVGIADQYDGFPAYLWLEKGTYDVVIYKEGFQTISRQYSVYPGVVIDVNDHMVPGESLRPEELVATSTVRRDERLRRDRERAAEAEAERNPYYATEAPPPPVETKDPEGVGRLLLQIQPGDAAIYLDGQFLGTANELAQLSAGLLVEPGEHVVELLRPGYQSERIPITVPPGERANLDLTMQER